MSMIPGWVGFPGALQYQGKDTGQRVDKDGHRLPIRYIVIHGTNSAASLDWWIRHAGDECAVTYMIGYDGRIAQFESDLSNHWGNGVVSDGHDTFWDQWSWVDARGARHWYANEVSISIEHEKHANFNNEPLHPLQAKSSFALVAWLCRMYDVPKRFGDDEGGVVGHRSVNPIYRSFCPGPYPWDDLWSAINAPQYYIPAGWVDNGSVLAPPGG
jgi:N-acetyl-anhydromuramyl-L-alanine amidase AmpD